MSHLKLAIAFYLLLLAAFANAETTPASGSSIRITKIQPSIAEMLKPGDRTTFVVDLKYTVAAESGGIALVIQRAERGHGPIGYAYEKVGRGSGTITLRAEVKIPETTSIQIFTPLYHEGGGSTSVVDGRVYEVAAP